MAKRALLVGVNEYQLPDADLAGCVNDVLDMHFSLRSLFGFTTREIRVLTDGRATKANILERLQWLVKGAKPGDFMVFHFSGHGSQVRDRDGDELRDRMDEILCPHDMDWDGTYLSDDELNTTFKDVPEGALLEVFIDSCHSGTALRAMGLEPPPELATEHPTRNRYLPPPTDVLLRHMGEEDELKQSGFARGFEVRKRKHHILWAGCMDNQTSADAFIEDRYHGAFTYHLNRHLRRDPAVSRKELLRKVRASLKHGGFTQTPQLEIDATQRDRTLFVSEEAKLHLVA